MASELRERLEAARAEVARLEHEAATATCAELGHDWHCLGGANCGCFDDACCSVPVHECRRCGACDYGENEWARDQIAKCPLPAEYGEYLATLRALEAQGGAAIRSLKEAKDG